MSLTQVRLKELLSYDPKTGVFTWKEDVGLNGRIKAGSVAGYVNAIGYASINIGNKCYLAHRLAFLYMTGSIPEQVDHINHIRNDNHWANLREATDSINGRNKSLLKNNKSGVAGVHEIDCWTWIACIQVDGVHIHLGTFYNKQKAIAARKAAELKYNFHLNHGAA